MTGAEFVRGLEEWRDARLRAPKAAASAVESRENHDPERLLQVALANELNVSDLAALYASQSPEIDIKLAFARQAGDEARHFELVGGRLAALGFDPARFAPPGMNPLFEYLRGLTTSVERLAAGLFTLEAMAYMVNERFMQVCALRGDRETVRLYREFIQPDEQAHAELGRTLLALHADTDAAQAAARAVVERTLELAALQRARLAERLGTHTFPGC